MGEDEDWARFLKAVEEKYTGDPNFSVTKYGLEFTQGECPRLLKTAHRFRRFSSKYTGSRAGNVWNYIKEVQEIAQSHFGEMIHPWHDRDAEHGREDSYHYGWDEVYAELKCHWEEVNIASRQVSLEAKAEAEQEVQT
ncbi:hypothetical protein DXG01_005963 [Tephrocybe rancida]|nr:hypothetical protein DXG01_005963 [Tephrocybe rancida]